jgi:dihydrofolate reductase
MRKIIFVINVTIDGFADHTAVIADDELHDFYTNLLKTVDIMLYGRKTYELMESFWPEAHLDPKSTKSMVNFANEINAMQKIVFSTTLTEVTWNNTRLVKENMLQEIRKLKKQEGKFIAIGGLSIASVLAEEGLIDEFWFLIQPIILGMGKPLFTGLKNRINLVHAETKLLKSGVVAVHYYKQ